MGIANRVINVLVLLASIGAVVLTIMLFGKREEVVAGRNSMAQAISDNSNKLAATSTENPAKVKIEAAEMDVAQGNDSVDTALKKFDDVTKAIILQRNTLAKELVDLIAIVSEHDEKDGDYSEFKDEELANVKTNKEKFDEISAKADKIIALYKQTREAYIAAVKMFEEALEMEGLSSETLDPKNPKFGEIKTALNAMDVKIKSMYAHITNLNEVLPSEFQIGGDMKDANYTEYLSKQKEQVTNLVADRARLQEEVKKLTAQVEELTAKVEELTGKLEAAEKARDEYKAQFEAERAAKEKLQNENNILKEKVASLEKKVKDAEKMGISTAPQAAGAAPTAAQISLQALALKKIEGKITYVNAGSGFVTLNIGSKTTVELKNAAGKMVKVPVVLPANAIMTVATSLNPADAKFVCKVQVYKVDENQAMANIIPGSAMPKVGDVVYFSATDIAHSTPTPAGK